MISIDEILVKYKTIIAWGCGKTFQVLNDEYAKMFDYVVDSDSQKWGALPKELK